MILRDTIIDASLLLKKNSLKSHLLDAEVILAHIMGVKKEFLLLNENISVSKKIRLKFNHSIIRRINNEPVAYITGKKTLLHTCSFIFKSFLTIFHLKFSDLPKNTFFGR